MKNKKLKAMPRFKSEEEERTFWDTVDATEYFDLGHPVEIDLSKLKTNNEVSLA